MSLRLQIIVCVLIIISMLLICNLIRKRKLDLKYALIWLFVGGIVLIFDIFPMLLGWVTDLLGITFPVNMLFFMGFVFALLIIFTLTMAVSKLSERVKQLTQELALLEKEVKKSGVEN